MAAAMIFTLVAMPLNQYAKIKPFYDWHRAMGFVLLMLVILRLIIKFASKPPSPLPDKMPAIQKTIAKANHILLYLALSIHPFIGWYATNAWGGAKIPFFGIWHLPRITEKDRELGNFMLEIHHYTGWFIMALVVMHIGAALYHHYVKKDCVLIRMTRT